MPNIQGNASVIDQAGSAIGSPISPNNIGGGVGGRPGEPQVDYKWLYEDLQTKLGQQGNELGELRGFFEGMSPLLDILNDQPELVTAIVNGKLDKNLAMAAMEGKLSIEEAKAVQNAHEEVKKELGSNYKGTSAEDIAKLIEDKISNVMQVTDSKIKEAEEIRVFEAGVNDFVNNTPDFGDYASEIDKWLDKHNSTDLETAYWAVKGKLSDAQAKKMAQENAGEAAKNMALNAMGGGVRATEIHGDQNIVDALIGGRTNANIF